MVMLPQDTVRWVETKDFPLFFPPLVGRVEIFCPVSWHGVKKDVFLGRASRNSNPMAFFGATSFAFVGTPRQGKRQGNPTRSLFTLITTHPATPIAKNTVEHYIDKSTAHIYPGYIYFQNGIIGIGLGKEISRTDANGSQR